MNKNNFLTASYPLFTERKYWLIYAILSGIFVSVFLIFFKPFGIKETTNIWFLMGFGFITLLSIIIVSIIFPILFPKIFIEEKWSVIKQIGWLSLIILLVAFLNNIYADWYYGFNPTFWGFLTFLRMVLSLGIFILTGLTTADYIRRLKNYENSSEILNNQIHSSIHKISDSFIELADENQKDKIKLSTNDLLFIKADDNYIEIHYKNLNQNKKTVFRNTLKAIETATESHLFRCHRTYLVNLKKVIKISGNAQGYRLHFDDSDNIVPVSREKGKEIKDAIDHL